jgi:L-amino acid N-acyltransferase YncA
VSGFEIRPARPEDGRAMAELFAAVAAEPDGIATEPPVDIQARTTEFADASGEIIVAVAGKELVGSLLVEKSFFNFGEVAMHVAREWRGRGVGSALLAAGIEKGRADGLHKLSPDVFPHNEAAPRKHRCDASAPATGSAATTTRTARRRRSAARPRRRGAAT